VNAGDVFWSSTPGLRAKADAARPTGGARPRADGPVDAGAHGEGGSGKPRPAKGALTAAVFSISSAAAAIGQANADLARRRVAQIAGGAEPKKGTRARRGQRIAGGRPDLKQTEFDAASAEYARNGPGQRLRRHAESGGGLVLAKGS